MKEMGVNAIRCAHNPPSPEQLDLCDELGILVIDETFDE
jgi:beta-galactosidase